MDEHKRISLYDHRYGQGTIFKRNPNEFIVWIPKNASCAIRKRFSDVPVFFQDYKIDNYIIFLRDPIKRWISGFLQYMGENWDMFFKSLKDVDLTQIEFDEHTLPQYKFLPTDFQGKSKFYNIDNNGLNIFNNEYKVWGDVIPKSNITLSSPYKADLYRELMTMNLPTQRIKEYYSLDYKLLKACGH